VRRKRLAGLIAYIPLPVVAGYLGYVGYFCLAAGAAQSSGQPVSSLLSWGLIFTPDCIFRTLAGFVSFAFIYVLIRFWNHPLSMPAALVVVRFQFTGLLQRRCWLCNCKCQAAYPQAPIFICDVSTTP
jgi:sulfate permease, SulP family